MQRGGGYGRGREGKGGEGGAMALEFGKPSFKFNNYVFVFVLLFGAIYLVVSGPWYPFITS